MKAFLAVFSMIGRLVAESCNFTGVFITTTRQAHDNDFVRWSIAGQLHGLPNSMRSLQSWQDSFGMSQRAEPFQHMTVETLGVLDSTARLPKTVFRSNAGIVESRRNRVHIASLTVVVLHHVAEASMQDARLTVAQRRRVIASTPAASPSFDAEQTHLLVGNERKEHSRSIAAATDAGDHVIRQSANAF